MLEVVHLEQHSWKMYWEYLKISPSHFSFSSEHSEIEANTLIGMPAFDYIVPQAD